MKALTAREVQLGEFEILKKFAQICSKKGFKYYLFYGTLIGAVRHQGFIPWDDDVDVMMPRADYEKLLEYLLAHEEEIAPLKLMSYRNNKEYIYPISRLCDTRYYVDYQGAEEYGLGLFIDIYPFDGCGNTKEELAALNRKQQRLIKMTFQAGMKKFTKSQTAWWRTPIKFAIWTYAKICGANYFIEKLDKQASVLPYDKCKYVNCSVWENLDNSLEREKLEEAMYLPFEGEMFCVPKLYDDILREEYGDYMKLPPEEERVGHHYYTAYLKDDEQ